MRRTLGTLALLLALAGCGDDDGDVTINHPAPAQTHPVTLIHGTAGGGDAASRTTDVTSDEDLAAYVGQFDDSLAAKVTKAAEALDGDVVLAQVVSVGCDIPPRAHLRDDAIVPAKVEKPMQECFAPVTTVALAIG